MIFADYQFYKEQYLLGKSPLIPENEFKFYANKASHEILNRIKFDFDGEDIAELAQLASQMFSIGHVYYFKKTAEEDQFEAMLKQVKESLGTHDQILLKGSNSMNLAKLVESLENEHN